MSHAPAWSYAESADLFQRRDEENFMAKLYSGFFFVLAEGMAELYCAEAKMTIWNYLTRPGSIRLKRCLIYQPAAWLSRQNLSGLTVFNHKLWVRPPTASAVRDLETCLGFSDDELTGKLSFLCAVICRKMKEMKSVWILDDLVPEYSRPSQYILVLWCVRFVFIIRKQYGMLWCRFWVL